MSQKSPSDYKWMKAFSKQYLQRELQWPAMTPIKLRFWKITGQRFWILMLATALWSQKRNNYLDEQGLAAILVSFSKNISWKHFNTVSSKLSLTFNGSNSISNSFLIWVDLSGAPLVANIKIRLFSLIHWVFFCCFAFVSFQRSTFVNIFSF